MFGTTQGMPEGETLLVLANAYLTKINSFYSVITLPFQICAAFIETWQGLIPCCNWNVSTINQANTPDAKEEVFLNR